MPRILVQPEFLRHVAGELTRQTHDLAAIINRLSGALGGLDWQARSAAGVDAEWNRARALANQLTAQANDLARYAQTKAQAFDEADHAGAAGVAQVLGAFNALPVTQGLLPAQFRLHTQVIQFLIDLGKRTGELPRDVVTSLVGVGGLLGGVTLLGTQFLTAQSAAWRKTLDTAATRQIEKGALQRSVNRAFEKIAAEKNASSAATPTTTAPPPIQATTPAILDQSFKTSAGTTITARDLDGRTPLAGMNSTYGKPGQRPLVAPITSVADQRHPDLTRAVIAQFGVENNARYTEDDYTYCNTFAGDYARAMGAPLPTKAEMGKAGDLATLGAQPLHTWLINQGAERGWQAIDPSQPDQLRRLIEHVNAGKPALASDAGHIAVIRPDQSASASVADLHIAQAGGHNLNDVRLGDAGLETKFKPVYFIHE